GWLILGLSMPYRTRTGFVPRGWIWRSSLAVIVTALAVYAFRSGVTVSARSGVPDSGFPTQLYYSIGLFVLGGLDLGVPLGGPEPARQILWITYFVAPALTVGAVVEGLLRVWNPRWWRFRGLKDHIVVVGMGQIGVLYLEALRRVEPKRRVLVVDRRPDHVNVIAAQARHGALFLNGDIRKRALREALRLQRAAGVVLITGNDLTNLVAATDILADHPRLRHRIVAHVGDGHFERTVEGSFTAPDENGGKGRTHLMGRRLFNAHRIAADELVQQRLSVHFKQTRSPDIVVLAGFGRFGQTILERLQKYAADEFSDVVILDRVANMKRRQFADQIGFAGNYKCEAIETDLKDPDTWSQVNETVATARAKLDDDPSVIFVLSTDDDPLNLRTALMLRQRDPEAHIVVRCFADSSLTSQLSTEGRFDVFGVSSLLRDALEERHRGWFFPRFS
ncbi:MAG: NAD-binding protein, partial [Longimicrobiales bacterium]